MPAQRRTRIGALLLVVALLVVPVAAACGSSSSSGGGGPAIALLLPENKTARYESKDRPVFEARVREQCPTCTVLYSNAGQDATRQQAQAEAALTNGAKVLVLDPVDSDAAVAIVTKAEAAGVPVIAYERLIRSADLDAYISFDNQRVGRLQAQALVDKMAADGRPDGTIVMINGAPTDSAAGEVKKGAHSVFDASPVRIGAEYDTPDWSPDKAESEMEQAIAALGKNGIQGVYAANDGTAGGAIGALEGAGVTPIPPVTGQDAELAAIQRIVAGEQYMTVYKDIELEARTAADMAVGLANGTGLPAGIVDTQIDNNGRAVDAVLLDPVAVTAADVGKVIVGSGFWTVQQICTPPYAQACAALGLT